MVVICCNLLISGEIMAFRECANCSVCGHRNFASELYEGGKCRRCLNAPVRLAEQQRHQANLQQSRDDRARFKAEQEQRGSTNQSYQRGSSQSYQGSYNQSSGGNDNIGDSAGNAMVAAIMLAGMALVFAWPFVVAVFSFLLMAGFVGLAIWIIVKISQYFLNK